MPPKSPAGEKNQGKVAFEIEKKRHAVESMPYIIV